MNRNLETLIFSAALCFAACQAQAVQVGGNTQTTDCYQGPSGPCCPPYIGPGCRNIIHDFDDGPVVEPLDPKPYDPPIYPPPPPPIYPPVVNPDFPPRVVNPVVSCGPHGLVESYDHVSCLLRN